MLKWKYIFLTLGLIELAIGFSDARPTTFFYLGRPVGTVLLGLFLIFQVMERESALYNRQKHPLEPAQKPEEARKQPQPIRRQAPKQTTLKAAHSH